MKQIPLYRWSIAGVAAIFGLYFFCLPGFQVVYDLTDPAISSGQIPRFAWRLHAHLADPYAQWAEQRVAVKSGIHITGLDVAGSEWPLFGSVFYLQALESLQKAWELDHQLAMVPPKIYARRAIEASVNLVTDPNQANWVKVYWKDKDYLHEQDLFYRFLLISAMTSYTELTGNQRFEKQLRDQVETLSAEIDASPVGLLDDYPQACFPGDVMAALAAIQRADAVLHTDHTIFLQRARRAFEGKFLGAEGLPAFSSWADNGAVTQNARGSSNAYILIYSSELWPDLAEAWNKLSNQNYWQEKWGLVGFREFSKTTPDQETFMDVDSGPVVLNFGFAASAFGVGATRRMGQMDKSAPLTGELIASVGVLPNGTLIIPRLLSDATDAPYLGEACILHGLTRLPIHGVTTSSTHVMVPFTWFMLCVYFGGTAFFFLPLLNLIRLTRR